MIRYTVELARGLQARDDVELSVVADPKATAFFVDGLTVPAARVHALPSSATVAQALAERLALRTTVDLGGFDVVQGTKHLLPRRAPGRKVLTVHDMLLLDRRFDFNRSKRWLLPRPYLASINEADVLVCVSEATRQRLVSYAPAVRSRAVVVPLAMSGALTSAVSEPVDALRGQRFALIVGDPSPRKNVRHVTSLWNDVTAAVPDAKLALVGPPGWGRVGDDPVLDQLVHDGSVLRLGHLTDGQLRWAYEHAAVTLCPSLLEGFGLPALEAASFNSPLLISDDPALSEAAGGAGSVVPLADPGAWTTAIIAAMRRAPGERVAGVRPARRWSEVAEDTVAAVTGVSTVHLAAA